MDHLAVTNVDAGVVRVNHDVTRLGIGHAGPAHKGARGAKAALTAGEAVAYKAGAVKAVRANAAPRISATELAISARNNGAAVNGLARCGRRRSWSGR